MNGISPTEYAYNAGAEYRRVLMTDPAYGFAQKPMADYGPNDDLPDGDYADLKRRFGDVTVDMERAYKRGFNEAI